MLKKKKLGAKEGTGKSVTVSQIEATAVKLAEEKGVTFETEVFRYFKDRGYAVGWAKFKPILAKSKKLIGIKTGQAPTSKIVYSPRHGGLNIDVPYITINELVEIAIRSDENDSDDDKIVIYGVELKNINAEVFKETLVKHHLEGKTMKDAFLETITGAELNRPHKTKSEEDEEISVNLEGFTNEELRYISEHQLLGNGTDPNEFVNNLVQSAVQNATTGKLEIEPNGRISVTEIANMAGNLLGLIQRR